MNWQEMFLVRLPDAATFKDWLPYVSAMTGVTGIIGMFTGTAGYIRSGRMKALDLRLELHSAEDALRDVLNELPALIDLADGVRSTIYVADAKMLWDQSCSADRSDLAYIQSQLPEEGGDYRRLSHRALEARLVDMNKLRVKTARMREKYLRALAGVEKKQPETRELSLAFARSMQGGS
jgi:hypothetical protein